MRNKILILIITFFLYSCGTGPWFMPKNVYTTYKEEIYISPNDSLKTNGYYLQVGELHPNTGYRNAIIFLKNGYTIDFQLDESQLENSIKSKITLEKNIIYADLDWWKIKNDSLLIEHFADPNFEMFTYKYFQKGRIISDTLIELKYDDSKYLPIKYRFVKTDSLPKLTNSGRYLKKKWYNTHKNKSRN